MKTMRSKYDKSKSVKLERTHTIYRIVSLLNGKSYIGQTVDPKMRLYRHFKALDNGKHHNRFLQDDYTNQSKENFVVEILEGDIPVSKICEREKYWIKKYDTYWKGYNTTIGGENNRLTINR